MWLFKVIAGSKKTNSPVIAAFLRRWPSLDDSVIVFSLTYSNASSRCFIVVWEDVEERELILRD